jgi:hypothetical protein
MRDVEIAQHEIVDASCRSGLHLRFDHGSFTGDSDGNPRAFAGLSFEQRINLNRLRPHSQQNN